MSNCQKCTCPTSLILSSLASDFLKERKSKIFLGEGGRGLSQKDGDRWEGERANMSNYKHEPSQNSCIQHIEFVTKKKIISE